MELHHRGSKTNFQWHLNLDGNQTSHVGMTVEGRKNKAVVSFAAEGTCSPFAFGAVIEYPTLSRAAADKNAYLSAMQDRLLSKLGRPNLYFEFSIGFEEAKRYREANCQYLRPSQWQDLTCQVYI